MFNPTLIKHLGKEPLTLSDGHRHEKQMSQKNKFVRFFTHLQAYASVKSYSRGHANLYAKPIKRLIDKKLVKCSDIELQQQFSQTMERLLANQQFQYHLQLAFACVGEGIKRTFGFYPHDVQYWGANILLRGQLSEMQTGEGKTIVAGMTATIVAGTNASVHVLSTNEYLATRDQIEMSALFNFFSIGSGAITGEMDIETRTEQYSKPICYVSASELVFDVLKDSLNKDNLLSRHQSSLRQYVQNTIENNQLIVPALHFCIVDEADSVLIDEASTPLIISQEADSIMEEVVLNWALAEAKTLKKDKDFSIDLINRDIDIYKDFNKNIQSPPPQLKPMWQTYAWQKIVLKKALTALHLFHLDEHYIVHEDKIIIVDESTGRPMPDRSWEQGLHQMIELKEGLETSKTRETIAQMTFQCFFRRYLLLSGLTGTAQEVSREMWNVYGLSVCVVPSNKTNLRKQLPRQCFKHANAKWQAVAKDALKRAKKGQPVLIGTRSVEASEIVIQSLSEQSKSKDFNIFLLNARQDAEEAGIIAKAGNANSITIATNMAGRGTDIKLDAQAKKSGGLHVILTEHHDSKRIDRQLIGRSARQGDAGSYREMVCLNDAILLSNKNLWQTMGQYMPFNICRVFFYSQAIRIAQKRAQNRQYEIRMNTLKQDRKRQEQIGFIGQLK